MNEDMHKTSLSLGKKLNSSLMLSDPSMPGSLVLEDAPRRSPVHGEVEIEVVTAGINFKEVLLVSGLISIQDDTSLDLGMECAGRIVNIGDGVENLREGDGVIAFGSSCFSNFVTTSASLVALKPSKLTFEEGATLPVAFSTAFYVLTELARLKKGERVLIHSAAGGVGLAAIQICQMLGADVYVTAGNSEKRSYLASLGIQNVMDSRSPDFSRQLMDITKGKGVDIVLNSLGRNYLHNNLEVLSRSGRYVELANIDNLLYRTDLTSYAEGISLINVDSYSRAINFGSILRQIVHLFEITELTSLPYQVFSIREANRVFDYMARSHHIGKVLMSLSHIKDTEQAGEKLEASFTSRAEDDVSQNAASIAAARPTRAYEQSTQVLKKTPEEGLLPSEGVDVFMRILNSDLPQVIVSTKSLWGQIEQYENIVLPELLSISKGDTPELSPEANGDYITQKYTVTEKLSSIWQDLLGVEEVSVDDNFIDLGGHSLLATMLFSRIREIFHVDVSLGSFLESPTIFALSQSIEAALEEDEVNNDLAIQPVNREIWRTDQLMLQSFVDTHFRFGENKVLRVDEKESLDCVAANKEMQFSLFFFAANEPTDQNGKYNLMIESAKFADREAFAALWTPERHFHSFGGLYASPAITSAALAMITKDISIRAGSVVLPLQNPVRVAEEWAMVDNLSNGRVAVSFASGWHVDDFVLMPDAYTNRRSLMYQDIELIKRLWNGDLVELRNGVGLNSKLTLFPKPLQKKLPIWVTCDSLESFVTAGKAGINVLTSVITQDLDELSKKIIAYRKALVQHGHDSAKGHVTLMQHTFLGSDINVVEKEARDDFQEYIKTNVKLQASNTDSLDLGPIEGRHATKNIETIANNAFERIFNGMGLVGTVDGCVERVDMLRQIGVNEVACLIDFVTNPQSVMSSLYELNKLKNLTHEDFKGNKVLK